MYEKYTYFNNKFAQKSCLPSRQKLDITKPKLSLYSPYYAETRNEFEVPSPRHSANATQLLT